MQYIKQAFLLFVFFTLIGCTTQFRSSIEHNVHILKKDKLKEYGMSFITPTTITGMEQDKQYLALTFSHELKKLRPELTIGDLSTALGLINQTDLAEDYKKMYDDYAATGIFNKKILKKIGVITKNRYLCQLILGHFESKAQGRLGLLGLSITDTESANLRLFVQVWDSQAGIIVWEAAQELNFAYDTMDEKPVTFEQMIKFAANDVAKVLP